MSLSKAERKISRQRMRYSLEFVRFFGEFIVLIAIALILMQVISAHSNTLLKSTTAHTAQGNSK